MRSFGVLTKGREVYIWDAQEDDFTEAPAASN
jgi:hypothetical protein